MSTPTGSWPLDSLEHLEAALREHDAPPDEAAHLAPELMQLADWAAPLPAPADTQQLLERLLPLVPAAAPSTASTLTTPSVSTVSSHSPVRQALQSHWSSRGQLGQLLSLVRAQVSLFSPAFWLVSLLVVLIGNALLLSQANLSRALVLQIVGPLLSYIGAATAFRGFGLNALEFELACPPSPRQLTLARLFIVLAYDLALGLLSSLVLNASGGEGVLALSVHWLAPLLLVAGVALFLSLRLPVNQAGAIAYTGWLALLVLSLIGQSGARTTLPTISGMAEIAFSSIGLALLIASVAAMPRAVARLLPRH